MSFFNKILKKFVLRFDDHKLEEEYFRISIRQQKLLMLVLNIAQFVVLIYDTLIGLHSFDSNHLYSRFTLIAIFGLNLAVYKRFPIFFEVSFVIGSLLSAYYTVLLQILPVRLSLYDNFKKGMLVGVLQVGMMLSIKRYWPKIIVQGIFLAMLVTHLNFYSQFYIQIFALAFWAFLEMLQRSLFRDVKFSEESFKKFKTLVSKDLPTAIIILDDTFKFIKFTNDKFNELLKSKENMEKINVQNDLNISHLIQNIKSFKNYLDWYQKTISSSSSLNTRLTGYLNLPGVQKNHFDIKIRKITWNKSESIAILLDPITEKLNLIAVQKASEYKDEVIAAVSHELRTPINGIIGMISILMSKNKNDEMAQYLKNCLSCANLLKSFVNSILDINQIKATKLKLNFRFVNLVELFEELRSIFEFQISSKGLSFITSIDSALPKLIRTDKNRLLQILINLTTNAIKFTSKGSISIFLNRDPNNSDNILFKVIDTGIGIKEENLQKLFKKFGKLENDDHGMNEHGVGLGLMISNELVKIFNQNFRPAQIQVSSTIGEGTTFSFTIPIDPSHHSNHRDIFITSKEDSWVEMTFDFEDEPASKPKKNIYMQNNLLSKDLGSELCKTKALVIDDLPFNLIAVEFLFKKLGLECKTVLNGNLAIEALRKYDFDIIFLDLNMPEKDGFQVAREMKMMMEKGEIKLTPIVALSAGELIEDQTLKKFGMCAYLMKPVNEEDAMKVLEEIII